MSSIDTLTQDLITQILVKLPVKTLLCCKSVSKPWLSLISSPNFIISHLKHTITNPGGADQTFIVHEYDDFSMYLLNLDAPQPKAPLGFPYSEGDYSFEPHYKIVGSCNGIVCVSVSNCERETELTDWYCRTSYYRNNPNTYLWNPATKQSKLVPPHNICGKLNMVAMGFGFDFIGNDFKVLTVISSYGKPFCAEVYSANADVWRKVDPRPTDYPGCDEFDVCVNGFLCCEGFHGMMAFDLEKEVFTCGIRPLPATSFNSTFIDFNGSVGIITKGCESKAYNLWTLDDEACLRGGGVKASWTPRLSIDVDCPMPYPRVYGCFDSGEFLLCAGSGTYLLHNSRDKEKEPRNVPLLNIIGRRLIKYNESLVSITGSKKVHWNAQENDI
ncbi:F-box domain-containing protein [Heracleum sosnowskyi]|uniref:F-box domain-containing protein n=1 Tax=Heracleum sosnowskyi TaxID=360622 RepID=A0AAD8N1S2_9APIA|nr:F-box domain-containing protein [Heracleum sosnowskyi]